MSVSFTARGSGYYRVFVDGAQVSRHVAEREAAERAVNEAEANPDAHVRYDHDYEVDVAFVVVSAAPDTTAPTLSSATIPAAGTSVTFAFSEPVYFGAGGNSGFAVTMSGGAATLTYSSGEGTSSLVYTTSRVVNSGETGTCAYTQPTNGVEDGAGNDLVTFSGTSVTNNSTAAGYSAGSPLFFDDFNYVVTDDPADDVANLAAFEAAGWQSAKGENVNYLSGKGNVFTLEASAIPGFSGSAPGSSSSKALCLEALPNTLNGQTDFWLQYGDLAGAYNQIPADVWIQFWLYPNYYGAQLSRMDECKFLYMTEDGYPSHTHTWMFGMQLASKPPFNVQVANPTQGEAYFGCYEAAGYSDMTWDGTDASNQGKLGSTDWSEYIKPNRWQLVKLHINTSYATGANSYEAWIKPQGGAAVKVAEWISGQQVEGDNFTWDIPGGNEGGHRALRIPTTWGRTGSPWYDYWMYMRDFAIATSEANLPSGND